MVDTERIRVPASLLQQSTFGEILPPLVGTSKLALERRHVLVSLRLKRDAFLSSLGALGGPRITVRNAVDQEPCPSTSFEFVPFNHMSRELTSTDLESVLYNRAQVEGCECTDSCVSMGGHRCECLTNKTWDYGDGETPVIFAYDKHGRVIDWVLEDALPIYECTESCGCTDDCPNKVVWRGRQLELEVFKTTKKGWGVCSPVAIPKGTFISCYRGELLDPLGAEARGRSCDEMGETYLFDLDEWEQELEEQQIPILTIDAHKKGDISRFFNHSCDPTLKTIPVTNGNLQEYDIAFFAKRDIKPWEELTFDYCPEWASRMNGTNQDLLYGEEEREWIPYGECYCATQNCRGWIFVK